jgi:uncharacterized protein (TIGR03435 family)
MLMVLSSRCGGPARRCGFDEARTPSQAFTAFQEQLGFELSTTNAPANLLVIDSVSKPSENQKGEPRE